MSMQSLCDHMKFWGHSGIYFLADRGLHSVPNCMPHLSDVIMKPIVLLLLNLCLRLGEEMESTSTPKPKRASSSCDKF